MVRFDFSGQGGLAELALHTWTQLSPPSLPRLFAGRNPLHFATGDRYGHCTSVEEIRLNLRDPAQLERYLVKLDGDYQPFRERAKIRGEAVLEINVRPETPIQWLTAGGYFHSHLGEKATENRSAILYSTDGPDGPWKEICRAAVPTWVEDWHHGMDGDAVLEQPVETVFLRYIGDPGLNQIWIYAHCLEPAPASAVEVTHGYEIDGDLHEDTFSFTEETDYEIDCSSEPENRFIRFAVDNKPTK